MTNCSNALLSIFAVSILTLGCAAKKELAEVKSEREEMQKEMQETREKSENLSLLSNNLTDEIVSLKAEKQKLENQLKSARSSLQQVSQQDRECPEQMKSGVVFKVQLGAYEEVELSEEYDTSSNFDIERQEEINQYVVGHFRDYYKADRLKKELRKMGVESAWIVPYEDGERVKLKEVLDEVEDQ
ncbi:MAG: hypothetical protein RIA69_00650 [Cyclobacteriaceae bacterium]